LKTQGKKNSLFSSFILLSVLYSVIFVTNVKPACGAVSDNNFYYYSSGRKITLPLSKEMVAVRFKPEVTLGEQRAIVESQGTLPSFSGRKELPVLKITLLPLRQAVTEETIIQTINSLNVKAEIEFANPVFHFPDADLIPTDEFIVKFRPSVSEEEINAFNTINNVEIARKENWADWYVLRVKDPRNMNTLEMANLYYESPLTEFSVPNFIRRLEPMSVTPNDTYFPSQWHLNNIGQSGGMPDSDIDAPEGWEISTGSSDIVIAIIDEGVDLQHEDLANKLVGGWDFVDFPPGDNDPSPWGNDAHGTACAGLAAATTNNGTGVAGVTWGCKIMPIRIASNEFGWYWTTEEWAANGIQWAADNGADVLSNSWGGGPDSDTIHNAIINAKNNGRNGKGCVIVFASGNYSEPVFYPAKYPEVIAVGATDEYDTIWYYSNFGSELDVVAPSGLAGLQGNIWTTDITGNAGYNNRNPNILNYTDKMGGTSAAAPQVAGLAALILSLNPDFTSDEVQSIIESTADDKGEPGRDDYYGWGRINVYSALLEASKNEQILSKTDNIGEGVTVDPNDEIIYTIYYGNPNDPNIGTLTDVNIVDYLPDEVDPINPFDPNYNSSTHTYTWNIGTLSPGDSNSITLTVKVNNLAEPLGMITNRCVLRSNEIPFVLAIETTDVNSWNPGVIYVDANAPGSNNGMSWRFAYRDLQDALAKARAGCGSQIWVAAGTYKPTWDIHDTDANFALVNGVPIYGGFPSGGGQRRWMTNETFLDGQIGGSAFVFYVVTATGIEDAIIDGFTIRGSYSGAGINLNDANVTIANCFFTDNSDYGIYCFESGAVITNSAFDGNNITPSAIFASLSDVKLADCIVRKHTGDGISVGNSNIEINRSLIERNSYAGLYCSGGSTLTLTNSVIRFNSDNYGGYPGIYLYETSSATIKNNWIHDNGTGADDYGIYIYNCEVTPLAPAIIRNNTIVNNAGYGICRDYYALDPNISNCIIWGNKTPQLYSDWGNFENVRYSCIQNGTTDNHNIITNPCFFDPNDPNDYHLGPNSPCIDKGDPNGSYDGETDIDGQPRRMDPNGQALPDSMVDMGADEYYYHLGDFNGDGIVNFIDYAIFADAWLINDYADLAVLRENWLYQANWWIQPAGSMMMGEGMSSQDMGTALASTVETVAEVSYPSVLAEQQEESQGDNQQQSMLAGEGETAGIWLVYDGNMTPNSGDEITVYIHSDPMLLCMGIIVEIAGDANITTAMSEAECNNYGWDNGWNSDPYIDPNGWLFISGVSWESVVNGTVGYFKFRYNSGEVTVSVTEESCAYDAYFQPVLFSLEPLIFGCDPNEQ
jgi:subtilisin family serine protease